MYVAQYNEVGAVSIGNYYNHPGILGRQNKRVVIDADINGDTEGDAFSVTAGYTKYFGIAVKTRGSIHYSYVQSYAGGRSDSNVVSVGIALNTAFVLPGYDGYNSNPVATASFTTSSTANNPVALGFTGGAPSTLTFSVATLSAGSFVVTVPFRPTAQSGNAPGVLIPWSQSSGPDEAVNEIYRVSVLSADTTVVSGYLTVSNIVTVGSGGFQATFSGVPTTGSYTVCVEEKRPAIYSSITGSIFNTNYSLSGVAVCCQGVSTVSVSTTITLSGLDSIVAVAGEVVGGGNYSVSAVSVGTAVSALSEDWTMQDLQVNLRTRAVESSLNTIRIKPGENMSLGVVFHLGGVVVDPGATAIRFAVRSPSNSGPYYIYNSKATVLSVAEASYYRMEISANDEDLLTAQAASLLAGSNAAQSLVGEIQWVTTLGTFSSDSFTINAPNEVIREPDV